MKEASSLLRTKGLRATPGRIGLLESLIRHGTPISAEELHGAHTDLDLVTVYRTLQSFVSTGLACEVRFKDAHVRYEFAKDAHHHHVVCTRCGVVNELPTCDFASLEKDVLKKTDNFASIEEHALEFFGTCSVCARTSPSQ